MRRSTLQSLEESIGRLTPEYFFFQAEDGIRDDLVTGVQTCALPIYLTMVLTTSLLGLRHVFVRTPWQTTYIAIYCAFIGTVFESAIIDSDHWRHYFLMRSEERRVGKECRYREWPAV